MQVQIFLQSPAFQSRVRCGDGSWFSSAEERFSIVSYARFQSFRRLFEHLPHMDLCKWIVKWNMHTHRSMIGTALLFEQLLM